MIPKIAIDAVKKFKSGISKGNFKNSHANNLCTYDLDIFNDAVYAAYLDASRTFEEIGNKKDSALSKLAESILDYFKGDPYTKPEDFDTFHDGLCTNFIKNLKDETYSATYGQAQKVVNMTFKYLYCLDDAIAKYDEHFRFCHIALDTFTLEWIWRKCRPSYTGKVNKYEAWSNLEKTDYTDSHNTKRPGYDTIKGIYRDHFPKDERFKGCTPFQAEFIFWPEIQLELSSEQFLIQLEEANKSRVAEIKHMSLEDKKAAIKRVL